jgi:hypothetical protein
MQWSNKVMRWPGSRLNYSITRFCWAYIIANESLSSVARNKVYSGFFWSNRVMLSILAWVTSISILSQRTWLTSIFRLNESTSYRFLQCVGIFSSESGNISWVYNSAWVSREVLVYVHLTKGLLALFTQIFESTVRFKFGYLCHGAMFASLIHELFVVRAGLGLVILGLTLWGGHLKLVGWSDRLFGAAIWEQLEEFVVVWCVH